MLLKNLFVISLIILLATAVSAQDIPIGLQRLKEHQMQIASGITFFLAFFAGLISMTSPCGIALLPTFFSVAFRDRKKSLSRTTAFSAGLMLSFIIFGFIAGALGDFFNSYKLNFAVFSGFVMVLFGILLFLNSEFFMLNFRMDHGNPESLLSAGMLGFFFGIAWTPCTGQILAGILILAANSATALNGAIMLGFYGLGIVAPLIFMAYFSDKYDFSSSRFLRGKLIRFKLFGKEIVTHTYNVIGGIMLIVIGLLVIFFKGTFFFQTELPKMIPWSMSFWGEMNDLALKSPLFGSTLGNLAGLAVFAVLVFFLVYNLYLSKLLKRGVK